MKKIIISIFASLALCVALAQPTFAGIGIVEYDEHGNKVDATGAPIEPSGQKFEDCHDPKFLGLTPWYEHLVDAKCEIIEPKNQDELIKYIWTVVMNVVTMVTQVIGYIAVAMVIWGGFMYLFSAGNPTATAKGKKTIMNSVIGICVCVLASTLSGAVSSIINGALKDGGVSNAAVLFGNMFNHAALWAGIICVLMISIAGLQCVISRGDTQKVAKAKSTVINTTIGLVVIMAAAAIINFALAFVGE